MRKKKKRKPAYALRMPTKAHTEPPYTCTHTSTSSVPHYPAQGRAYPPFLKSLTSQNKIRPRPPWAPGLALAPRGYTDQSPVKPLTLGEVTQGREPGGGSGSGSERFKQFVPPFIQAVITLARPQRFVRKG